MMLAEVSDGFLIGMGIVQGILALVAIVQGFNQFRQSERIRRAEHNEQRLEQMAEQLIDAKMANKIGELTASLATISAEVRQINQRLNRGDEAFDEVGEKAHRVELLLEARFREFQKWMLETFQTKHECEARHVKRG